MINQRNLEISLIFVFHKGLDTCLIYTCQNDNNTYYVWSVIVLLISVHNDLHLSWFEKIFIIILK